MSLLNRGNDVVTVFPEKGRHRRGRVALHVNQ
jgi:hypothetical protein